MAAFPTNRIQPLPSFVDKRYDRYNKRLPRGSMGPLGMQVPGMGNPSTYSTPLPPGSMGPLGPQGPVKPGPSAAQLQQAWNAFHPQAAPAAPQTGAQTAQSYEQMFQQSLNNQRASIDATLKQVMGDIDTRRAQGQQVLGLMPGEVNTIYNQGGAQVNANVAGAQKSLAQAGAATPTGAQEAGVQAIRAAMEMSRSQALGDQPYLQIGMADLFNRQAGAAQMAAQQARNDIEAQRASYFANQAASGQQANNNLMQRFLLQQQADQQAALVNRASFPAGSARWWEANAAVNPEGTTRFAQNFNLNPDTLAEWRKKGSKSWQQAQQILDPSLIAFLRFQYGLK